MDNRIYEEVIEDCFGYSLGAIWDYFEYNFLEDSYKERIDKFLFVLERSMTVGILKLADEGEFLDLSIQKQIDLFKRSFPEKEKDMCEFCFGLDVHGRLWAPGGGVWICSDGDKIWT